MNKEIIFKNGMISIPNKSKKKIKGYYKNKNRIDLDSYIKKSQIEIKYQGVIFPMYIKNIEIEQESCGSLQLNISVIN